MDRNSQTETFIALECQIDNWRWSGVPFYLRTGKRMAEGAHHLDRVPRAAAEHVPGGPGIGVRAVDHLTFDLDESARLSLSFYGKRPGPSMMLDKLSMQFSLVEIDHASDTLEAYERLIRDAMNGDHTLFTTATGIERLWEVSTPLLEHPPEVLPYAAGSGPGPDPRPDRAPALAAAVRATLARDQGRSGRRASSLGLRSRGRRAGRKRLRPRREPAPPGSRGPRRGGGSERLASPPRSQAREPAGRRRSRDRST